MSDMETSAVSIDLSVDQSGVSRGAAERAWTWQLYLVVFISSACIMILELVAGRILAPYIGVSLYTWTTIIGVVLAGISLGNYLGGRLADRWTSTRLLGGILVTAGLLSLVVLAVDSLALSTPGSWSLVAEIIFLTTSLFLLPSLVLGMISPLVAKLVVRDLAKTGTTVGKIYAFGTAGSIVGTFATGFVLIAWFGTHAIVWGVAVVLISMGALFLVSGWRVLLAVALIVVVLGSLMAVGADWPSGPCLRETNYFCIKVHDTERQDKTVRALTLDRLVHSYTDLDDPTTLIYGYEQIYAEVVAYRARHDSELSALFVGGGGYTFPKYMEAVYPNSVLDVIEIDPGVTRVAYDLLGLSDHTRIVSHNEDARQFLERSPERRYDLILGDAFNDFSVPYHLTTREFNERVHAWLAEDGLYLLNLIDHAQGNFLRAYVRTLWETFRYVYVVPTFAGWRDTVRSTIVLIATDTRLDMESLRQAAAGEGVSLLAEQVLSPEEIAILLQEGREVVLTDRYAPVDQLLAPAFREEAPR